jgi:hypothetical protein
MMDNPGVPVIVAVAVGVVYGVEVVGSVAVTKTGAELGCVGAESVTSHALKRAAARTVARSLILTPSF